MMRWSIVAVFVFGCQGSRVEDAQRAKLLELEYNVPATWTHHEVSARTWTSVEWMPSDNERRESLKIVRTEVSPALAKAGPDYVEALLRQAQGSLPNSKITTTTRFTSSWGFIGVKLEAAFTPPGQRERYHRTHAVLVDPSGPRLLHVLYTAADPDDDLTAFTMVVNSLHPEEG